MKKLYTTFLLVFMFSFQYIISQTPYAFYPLDGNAHDVSGSWSGVINGTPTATANRYSRTSKAMHFNGTTDYIDLPSDFDFPNRTVIAWFNVSLVPSGNGDMIYNSDHSTIQNGLTTISLKDSSGINVIGLTLDQYSYLIPSNVNTWYQVALVRTPTLAKFYVNGAMVYSQPNPNGTHSGNGATHAIIGADRIYGGLTAGIIDDVLIYNTDLSDTAILTNYNAWRDSIVQVTGKLYFDVNQNNVFDSTDQPVRNQVVNIGNSYTAITNNSGDYIVYPDPGTYTIKPVLSADLSSFTATPDSIVVNADSLGITYPDNNFAIIAPANFCLGSVAVVAYAPPPRPGFNNPVSVRFVNALSATAVSQTIQFSYPPQQDYVSAVPTPTSVDTNTHTLTWNLVNITSGSLWQGTVTLHTPVGVAIGSIFNMSAFVSSSTCASLDSLHTTEQVIVRGSFDPNDKAVSPVGEQPGGRILSTAKLSYTIRFQNTGTFMAENVTVIDTISSFLNMATLKVEASSHNYEVLINGRQVTFRFSQINLPDSNTNEPLSHGFIKYSIQPSASFVQNSVVKNVADIYFDFNPPVRTNTTQNTADNMLSISKTQSDVFGFKVYPNPLSTGNWHLVTDAEMTGKEIKIFDVAGRNVYTSRIASKQSEIDASQFPQGVYLLRIENSVVRIMKL